LDSLSLQQYDSAFAGQIAALFTAAVHAIPDAHYAAAQRLAWAPRPPDLAMWSERLQLTKPLLAFRDARLAGFIELTSGGFIDCAYVHPDFQRQGVGGALIKAAEQRAKGAGYPRLYTFASLVAEPFFAKHGFESLRSNTVQRNGQVLNNTLMQKLLPGYGVAYLTQPDDAVWRLLLLADPSRETIEKYVQHSKLRVLAQNGATVGVCVLYPHNNDLVEIKNIAVEPGAQGRGIGRLLIDDAERLAQANGFTRLRIGTGNSSTGQLRLYESCGFVVAEVLHDFFVNNYPEPIWENGVQCRDMVVLEMSVGRGA